ncbi:hypothetical protein PsorP6_004263 [Peronosclerospora sorghi]|uniref:Uncharacterized protein n=1 Tax=Peronosclerospora sorghi TaxID=230839 RepID=A0ACC0VM85_9STRA|nr:hypothetical protein PsorP6_004263 [Peronosclerospora sorghi]
MSGSGRKSTYRKGVTKRVLYGEPEPKENEVIVRVTALRGNNLFSVVDPQGAQSVTMLPTKFRKLIWVKRDFYSYINLIFAITSGDYLIVGEGSGGEATTATGKKGAVTSIVEHILYKDQIKNLKQKGLWPVEFDVYADPRRNIRSHKENQMNEQTGNDTGEKESSSSTGLMMVEDQFARMHVNRNHRKSHLEDDDEEEDSDDE